MKNTAKKTYTIECFNIVTCKNDTVHYSGVGVDNSTWQDMVRELYNGENLEAKLIDSLEHVIGQLAWTHELDLRNDSELYHNLEMKYLFDKTFMEGYIKTNYSYEN